MSTALRVQDIYCTPQQYLADELLSDTRHEYLNGAIYAMAGASWEHNVITLNLLLQLENQLCGKQCCPFGSDRRLRIRRSSNTFFYYPDVSVDCSNSTLELEEPTVVFEVLSPDTDRIDYGEKMLNYQALPSMRVYVLVDQFRSAVTVYRRDVANEWAMEFLGDLSSLLQLPEIGCAIPLASIYERVLPAE